MLGEYQPKFRSRFEAFPISSAVKNVPGRLSATVDTGVLRVELESDPEADGYLAREESRLELRSRLLCEWWRKRYGRGATP